MNETKREMHGYSRTPTYHTWAMMKQRCNNGALKAYKNYGGRSIQVCQRWAESFVAFLEDMGEKPEGMSIDRIDNDGDYCKENCRWATPQEQARNTRRTRKIDVDGETRLLTDVATENGIALNRMRSRLNNGWTPEEAVGLDEHKVDSAITIGDETMTMAKWARRAGISRQAVWQRLKWGWPIEKALLEPRGSKYNFRHRGPGRKSKTSTRSKLQTIAVRLDPEQLQKLDLLVKSSGWNQSEIIRQLIDSAMIRPPVIMSQITEKPKVMMTSSQEMVR